MDMVEVLQEERTEQLMQEMERAVGELRPDAVDDLERMRRLMLRLSELDREQKAIQAAQTAALTGLVDDQPRANPGAEAERIARLLQAFELAAELARIADDVIGDTDIKNYWTDQRGRIVTILDAVDPQRRHLVPLLEHPLADVRAYAAVSLMKLMPGRAVPVLRAVHDSHRGFSAGWTAFFVLNMYDVEQAKKEKQPPR
jgi:hypothetical protein